MLGGREFLTQYSNSRCPINLSLPPLIDLHVHFDGGTLTRTLIEELARRNNISISLEFQEKRFRSDGSLNYIENDFLDFLAAYDEVSEFIRTPDDYRYVAYEYLKACAAEGAIYVELMFSPDHAKLQRKKYGSVEVDSTNTDAEEHAYYDIVEAIAQAIDEARDDFGIDSRIVMALLRHNKAEGCHRSLEDIVKHPHPYVVGIDLVGDEVNFPASDFVTVYDRARQAGLKTAVHAGEHTSADTITTTLYLIAPDRISHGYSAKDDPKLINYLKEKQIGLTMCLTSNLRLGVCSDINQHPFLNLLRAGVKVSINTDDPSFWGTSLGKEYALAKKTWQISPNTITKLCRNAVETSFAETSLKAKLLAHVDLYDCYTQHRNNHSKITATTKAYSEALAAYKEHLYRIRPRPILSQSMNGMLTSISDIEMAQTMVANQQSRAIRRY